MVVKYSIIAIGIAIVYSHVQSHYYIFISTFSSNSEPDDDSQFINFRESFMEFMDEIRD